MDNLRRDKDPSDRDECGQQRGAVASISSSKKEHDRYTTGIEMYANGNSECAPSGTMSDKNNRPQVCNTGSTSFNQNDDLDNSSDEKVQPLQVCTYLVCVILVTKYSRYDL